MIKLPAIASLAEMNLFTDAITDDEQLGLSVELSTEHCELHPMVLCMVAALTDRPNSLGTQISVVNPEVESPNLKRMGLLEYLKVPGLTAERTVESAGRFIPVRQIPGNRELNRFITDFVPVLHATPDQANSVKYVLSELIRNVLEHSGSSAGAYAAVELTDDNRILIGVADSGIGVRKTIRRAHAANGAPEAIALAFSPGVSGVTSNYGGNETNGGAGLFFMKAMATLSNQHMVMISESTMMRVEPQYSKDPTINPSLTEDDVTWSEIGVPFLGTAVGVDLALENSVAFAKLLVEIGQIYHLSVRGRKRAARTAIFT